MGWPQDMDVFVCVFKCIESNCYFPETKINLILGDLQGPLKCFFSDHCAHFSNKELVDIITNVLEPFNFLSCKWVSEIEVKIYIAPEVYQLLINDITQHCKEHKDRMKIGIWPPVQVTLSLLGVLGSGKPAEF